MKNAENASFRANFCPANLPHEQLTTQVVRRRKSEKDGKMIGLQRKKQLFY